MVYPWVYQPRHLGRHRQHGTSSKLSTSMPSGPLTPQNMGEMMWKTNGTWWFSQGSLVFYQTFWQAKKPNQLKTTKSKCIISSFSWTSAHAFFFKVPTNKSPAKGFTLPGTATSSTSMAETRLERWSWKLGLDSVSADLLVLQLPGWDHYFLKQKVFGTFSDHFSWFLQNVFCSAVSVSPKNAGVNMSEMQKDWGENIRTAIMEQTKNCWIRNFLNCTLWHFEKPLLGLDMAPKQMESNRITACHSHVTDVLMFQSVEH